MEKLINNLDTLLESSVNSKELSVLYKELISFMIKHDWRGACHESCGVQYVLLNELGINCNWRLGEVFYKERLSQGRPICFDHSWIMINDEIFDIALLKTNYSWMDSFPTINGRNLSTMGEPEVKYDTNSGWGDDPNTKIIKNMPLCDYLDSSPMHAEHGTWKLIQFIGEKLEITTSIEDMREKYKGTYWN